MLAVLNKIDNRTLTVATWGIVLLLAAFAFTFVLRPQAAQYLSGLEMREELKDLVGNKNEMQKTLSSLNDEVNTLQRKLHGDMAGLPEKKMEAYIIGQLQSISWNHGIELTGVKPSKGGVIQMFQEILFDVQLNGSYFDLFAWLQELREELGFIVIKKIELKPISQDQKDNASLVMNITVASYRSTQ